MARKTTDLQTIRSEGGLFPPDLLRRIADTKGELPGTKPADYGLPAGDRLNDAITTSYNKLTRYWAEFRKAAELLPPDNPGLALTNEKWTLPLLRELGFGFLQTSAGPRVDGRDFPISRFFGATPIHLLGCGTDLDKRTAGQRGAASGNPHGLVQEFLNRSDDHLWGIVSNGLRLRIMRDNQALSRQSYLEFDLEALFTAEAYADFVLLWMTVHATRFAVPEGGNLEDCLLERWARQAEEQGTRALSDLRTNVQLALAILGQGFVSHPRNHALREALRDGRLSKDDLHNQLLRIVYRFIFLFVTEDRLLEGRPLLHPVDESEEANAARGRYARYYSMGRLRELADRIKGSRHGDLWEQLTTVVGALSGEERFENVRKELALPALGSSLWDPAYTPHLNGRPLGRERAVSLSNADLLDAIRKLAFTEEGRSRRPVDYRNLGSEELGSVYEVLLELTPQVGAGGASFTFAEFGDSQRKDSGSFYTPDSMVKALLDAALDPLVEERTKGKSGAEAERAILSIKVCDPAVGSGHFLVGAAHRLAKHLARIRAAATGDSEPSPSQYQHALREVVGRCLYGVDIKPMSAELCRVSLWLEALEPGKPLSFLDHHIRVGNSLIGATPQLIAKGIPPEAFEQVFDDDKEARSDLRSANRIAHQGCGPLFAEQDAAVQQQLEEEATRLDLLSDERLDDIKAKAQAFREHERTDSYKRKKLLADAWCAAFTMQKRYHKRGDRKVPWGVTQATLKAIVSGEEIDDDLKDELDDLAARYQFFHWHLAFPEVHAQGGFDLMLGNPPWQALSPDKAQFFSRYVDSFRAKSEAEQNAAMETVLEDPVIAARWHRYQRELYSSVHFMKQSGRYTRFAEGNLGKGDFNVYRMFIEHALDGGRNAAQLVPGGLATGANTSAIRRDLLTTERLQLLYVFDNIRRQWFDVSVNSVALYVAGKPAQGTFLGAFQIGSVEQLQRLPDEAIRFKHQDVIAQSPELFAIPSVRNQYDADLTNKIYGVAPRFGELVGEYPHRSLLREVDMGNNRGLFNDQGEGYPVYEGRMIDRYDYRAKQYVTGRGASSVWTAAPWGSREKIVKAQWYVSEGMIPEKIGSRHRSYRLGWGDIADPSMDRSVTVSMIPSNSICGHKVPTMSCSLGLEWVYIAWLSVLNSMSLDFIARKQLASKTLTMSLLDSLPVPRMTLESTAYQMIAPLVIGLACTGPEMDGYRDLLRTQLPAALRSIADVPAIIEPSERHQADTRIDALVARELFHLTREEYTFILDSFEGLAAHEEQTYGEYRTKRLCLENFDTP